jgi:hypothetical protein
VFRVRDSGPAARIGASAAAACTVLAAAGCSTPSTSAARTPASVSSTSAASTPAPSAAMADMAASSPEQDKGAAAGIRLQSLIAQHSVLVADLMRARITRAPDVAQAADVALATNTKALSTLVDSLFGTKAGATFSDIWGAHIRYFYEYADALGTHDNAGLTAARAHLHTSETKIGGFFAGASGGRLTDAGARTAVTAHIEHLLGQADAFAKGNFAAAGEDYAMAYEHGFEMGGALASALLPRPLVAQLNQPEWRLRAALTNVLGEHVALVVAAMRAANGKAADFRAMGSALNANTVKLATAVDSLYGTAAAKRFQNIWADHVDALMAYTSSKVRGDDAGTSAAQARLRAFEPALARFLAGATASKLGAQALAHAFNEHDRMLAGELDSYQAKDYAQAHTMSYQAYQQMYDLAGQLSHAIGVTLGSKLPKGGSQTGGGGMARVVSGR